MYRDFLFFFGPRDDPTRQPIQRKSPKSFVNLPGRYKLKRHDARRGRDTLSREIKSGIRGQVRRRQDGDVLKCRARKGCSFDLASDRMAPRVSKFSRAGTTRRIAQMEYRTGRGDAPGAEGDANSRGWTTRNDAWNVIVGPSKYAHGGTDKDIFVAISPSPRSFACLSPRCKPPTVLDRRFICRALYHRTWLT